MASNLSISMYSASQLKLEQGRRTVAVAAAVRTRLWDARENFDQSGAGVNDEVGIASSRLVRAHKIRRACSVGAGLGTSKYGTDLDSAQDVANPEFGLFHAQGGDVVHHLDDLTPVARQDVDVEILQQLNDFGGGHQVPSGQTRSSGILHDFQRQIQRPRHDEINPVPVLDQPNVPEELTKPGSLAAVLKCIGRKEQRFRLAAAASDAGIGIAPMASSLGGYGELE
ncbi:hypothetical protein PG989_006648 [Apiospora arundinis]